MGLHECCEGIWFVMLKFGVQGQVLLIQTQAHTLFFFWLEPTLELNNGASLLLHPHLKLKFVKKHS